MSKALVVYDSQYGNTAVVARAVGEALSERFETKIETVGHATVKDIRDIDLLVVGSPTQGGRATKGIQDFIDELPQKSLDGKRVAAFDTRFAMKEHGLGLRIVMRTIGFAAERIARALASKGGKQFVAPEGFIVADTEGPINAGELERAAAWIRQVKVLDT
jgi:flavodoxin